MKPLETIFEDDDYIAVNKPSGLLTMPGRGPAASEKNLLALLTKTLKHPVFVIHRLDKDASGLILFAKNEKAHRFFSALFESRDIKKKYLVVVEGFVEGKKGEVDKPVQAYGSGRMGVGFDGKPSVTRYAVVERYKRSTMLEVDLVTGRRHQIRVHMYYIKHPVLGDRLYGDPARQSAYPRLMLHSYTAEFTDMSGRKRSLRAEPPADFVNALPFL